MSAPQQQPLLQFRFEGPAVPEGRILLGDLLQFVANFDLALDRLINLQETGSSLRPGHAAKATRARSALEVVATERGGSFSISLDLRRKDQPELASGKQGLTALLDGLVSIAADTTPSGSLDRGVLIPLRDASRVFDRGIDAVQVATSSEVGGKALTFNQKLREKIITRISQPHAAWTVAEGRLLMADVMEDRLLCRLHPSLGDPVLCRFDDSLVDTVLGHLKSRSFVRVRGEAKTDPFTSRIQLLDIQDIEAIEEPAESPPPRASGQVFWNPKTFDELAAEQGVYPSHDWDQLTGDWPEGADFEEFLAAVRSARQEE